jgi:hypothetical protein
MCGWPCASSAIEASRPTSELASTVSSVQPEALFAAWTRTFLFMA